jgi:hypothetical protein
MPASGVPYQVSLTPVPHYANGHPHPSRHPCGHPPPTHAKPPFLGTSTHASWGPPSGLLSYQDAVTSGTRSNTSLIQCAAATQDTRQATHSSGKMSSKHPREAIEEVEKAAFAMREELKEAKAAVEACYRRRARRAGLAGMLPAGRPMTEKELDTLSKLLGDGFRPRAKRRREIEQRTLIEMEADLGEVRTEIKRRRAGMGWLPLTPMLLLIFKGEVVEGFTA